MAKLEIIITLDVQEFKKHAKKIESDLFICLFDSEELDTELNLLGIKTDNK